MKRVILYILSGLALVSIASCSEVGALTCNYGAADISTLPEEHTILAGFAARDGLSDGIHTPLTTHCLTIRKGEEKICIISNDLMEISPALSDTIRTYISEKSGIAKDHILMHCIHTHSSPRSGGSSILTGRTNRAWKERMVATVVDNACNVIGGRFKPFDLEVGKTTADINGNRCEEGGPVDHEVYVARFLQRGKPIVSIVNFACHPVCMGPGSYLLSADYPGVYYKVMREIWGGDVFQLTGAAGNMDPFLGPKMVDYAEECGIAIAESLKAVEFTKVPDSDQLIFVNKTVDLPYRIDVITPDAIRHHADSLAATGSMVSATFADDVRAWEKEILARFETGTVPNKLRYHLHAVNLRGIIFFFSDGEPFCEYQQIARAVFPDETVFFAGYTNGQNSYLPSAHAYQHRVGYEYETEQMHVYIRAPYPLSEKMPEIYQNAVISIIKEVIK